MVKTTLALVLCDRQLGAWALANQQTPQRLAIQGESLLRINHAPALDDACEDIAERLRGDGRGAGDWHWLADAAGRDLIISSAFIRRPQRPRWQVLDWQWLAERFGLGDAAPWDSSAILEGELLPWLLGADAASAHRELQQALQRQHETEADRLAAERVHLQRENARLSAQNAALRQVDAERLVSFLPALFPRVFTVLGAVDLALLCGRTEPLAIPNPYPEPSEETLRTLQRQFRALPREVQAQIVRFVAQLPHRNRLQARPEVRELVDELEQGE